MEIRRRKGNKTKEDFRKTIIAAAKELFLTVGFKSTSIRKIAAKLNVSPTTIYLYFKDKSDIIYALHQEMFGMMVDQFSVLLIVEDPFERLKALGRSYLKFSIENPELYELMFMSKEPMEFLDNDREEKWTEGQNLLDTLISTIKDCQRNGYFPAKDSEAVAIQAWGMVHGLASLSISGHLCALTDSYVVGKEQTDMIFEAFDVYIQQLAFGKRNSNI